MYEHWLPLIFTSLIEHQDTYGLFAIAILSIGNPQQTD
jgi:hypothetical protein